MLFLKKRTEQKILNIKSTIAKMKVVWRNSCRSKAKNKRIENTGENTDRELSQKFQE